ncbi:MAG: NirD/YgiW/YdeI family stress tolerance protein [Candidatus Dactylopiibacterium sp.]|nr:NirD/YgiW/YdeI family stress tolerance protein [Candidatus Dactylopiibacterium sp.]
MNHPSIPSRRLRPLVALAALQFALLAPLAGAQYVGPTGGPQYRTVAEILKNPVDKTQITLTGHLLRKLGDEKYIFSDGTSEIRVEIDDRLFPAQPIDDKTRVRIRGEVDKDLLRAPDIEVEHLEILP